MQIHDLNDNSKIKKSRNKHKMKISELTVIKIKLLTSPFVSSNNGNWFPQSKGCSVTVYTSVTELVTVTLSIRAPFGMAGRSRRLLISAEIINMKRITKNCCTQNIFYVVCFFYPIASKWEPTTPDGPRLLIMITTGKSI